MVQERGDTLLLNSLAVHAGGYLYPMEGPGPAWRFVAFVAFGSQRADYENTNPVPCPPWSRRFRDATVGGEGVCARCCIKTGLHRCFHCAQTLLCLVHVRDECPRCEESSSSPRTQVAVKPSQVPEHPPPEVLPWV